MRRLFPSALFCVALVLGLPVIAWAALNVELLLSISVSVSKDPKETDLPVIPTKVEMISPDGSYQFAAGADLSKAFKTVTKFPVFLDPENPQKENLATNIPELTSSSPALKQVFLLGTGFQVFKNISLIRASVFPEGDKPCKAEENPEEFVCRFQMPSVQIQNKDLEGIDEIKLNVFVKGKITDDDFKRLPTELVSPEDIREDFVKANSRDVTRDVETGDRAGYFLYARYTFRRDIKEPTTLKILEKNFEIQHSLSIAHGRLALLPGDFRIEKETTFESGEKKRESASALLTWKTFIPVQDLKFSELK